MKKSSVTYIKKQLNHVILKAISTDTVLLNRRYCMKQGLYLLGFMCGIMGLSACYDEPEYPDAPTITNIDDIYFVDVPSGFDTLVVRVYFQDGDGDLGLTAREGEFFDPYRLIRDSNGDPIKYDPANPDLPPFNCNEYVFPAGNNPLVIEGDTIVDTVRAELNPLVRNFELAIFTREENGEYQEVDFGDPSICRAPLGGRFPPLKDDFSNTKPLEGIIQFSAPSLVYRPLFRNDSLKIGVLIRDRAGHESNLAISEPFVLNDITRQSD